MALESLGAHLENQGNQFADKEGRKNSMHSDSDGRAIDCFEKAIIEVIKHNTKDADSKRVADTDIANIYRNRGYTYAKLENYEEAIKCFENAEDLTQLSKVEDADPTDISDTYRNHGYAIAKKNYCAESIDKNDYSHAIYLLRKSTTQCPNFALAWNTKGYIHTMFENYKDAEICFAKARKIDPDFARAWRNHGYVLYCIEKDRQLKNGLDPDEIDENAKEKEKLDKVLGCVIEYLNKAIELDPHDPYAWHYRAHVHFRKKEYDNAIRDFDKAIQIRFSFYDAWYGKGMVLDAKEQYEEAVKCFDQAIKLYKGERIEIMEECKKLVLPRECGKLVEYKKLAYVFISKGMSHVNFADLPKNKKNKKDLIDAEKSFDNAIKIFDAIQESGVAIEKDVGMGLALYNKGYTIADSVVYDMKRYGTNHIIYRKEPAKRYEEAVKCFKDAIVCFKKSRENLKHKKLYIANILRNKGFIHAKLAEISSDEKAKAEHNEAIECFEESTKEESSFALAWNSRGYHFIGFLEGLESAGLDRKETIANAKICFHNAIENAQRRGPEHYTGYEAYFYYNMGYALFTSGSDKYRCKNYSEAKKDFEEAAGCFEKALTFDREYADAWCIRALSIYYSETSERLKRNNNDSNTAVYTTQKYDIIESLDNSIELYEKAELYEKTENNEKFALAWYQKGIVLASLGRYEEAISCFDESTSLNYKFGEAWYRKGVSFYSTQNYRLAIKCFDEADDLVCDSDSNYYIELRLIRGQSKFNAGNLRDAMNDFHEIPDKIPEIKYKNEIEKNEIEIKYKKTLSQKYLSLGLIYYKYEDLEMAKKMYEEAKRYDPNLAEVHYNLAKLHSTMNENNEAKKSLDRCINILDDSPNGKEELREKAREAKNKYKESRHTDWYQWWLGRGIGRKIAGIVLIVALISFIVSPIVITDRAIIHLINSNSTAFTGFITSSVTAQTIAAFTLAIGALLAILLLPSLQKFRVATIELETAPVNVKDQEVMVTYVPKISPPEKNVMPYKITAQYFRMPLRYQTKMQVYAPIEPTPAPTKYKKILSA